MTITTNATGKAASRPQPAPSAKPVGAKNVKDDITVLKEQPRTTRDANDAQRYAPSQKATTTRPERAPIPESTTTETTTDWSEEEENSYFPSTKSSTTTRTSTQICCTPLDTTMASKKKKITMTMKFKDSNATSIASQSSKHNEEININSLSNNLIEILMKIQKILSQKVIRNDHKLNTQ